MPNCESEARVRIRSPHRGPQQRKRRISGSTISFQEIKQVMVTNPLTNYPTFGFLRPSVSLIYQLFNYPFIKILQIEFLDI